MHFHWGRLRRNRRMFASHFRVSDVPQSEGDALIWLYQHTTGPNWTNKTNWLVTPTVANWFGVTVTLGHVTSVVLPANGLAGNISAFPVHNLPAITSLRFESNASLSGDASGWTIPATMQYLYFHTTGMSGTPDINGNTAMRTYLWLNCGLNQANVDSILLSVYNRRMAFTFGVPALNVGGTNVAPSGVYQAACPPTTGKEYAFELVTDSCGDGFIKWAVTFTP